MPILLNLLTVGGYLLTSTLIYLHVITTPRLRVTPLQIKTAWGATLALHAVVLWPVLVTPAGLDVTIVNSLSLIAWLVSLLLFLASFKDNMEALALSILPLAAIALLIDAAFPSFDTRLVESGHGVEWHVLTSLLAFSLLFIAAVQALLIAWLDHRLRHRQLTGWTQHLPPLQHMERFLFHLIAVGFALLSASLLTGWLFLEDMFAQHLLHKTVLSILAWFVFGILLLGRWLAGWRGRTSIRWTLAGFTLLLLAYFGSKLVIEVILDRK